MEAKLATLRPAVRKTLDELGFAVEYLQNWENKILRLHNPGVVLLSVFIRGNAIHVMGDERYEETGGSLGVTHYGQLHDIITGEGGLDMVNVYFDLENHPLPRLPQDLQKVLPELLPLHPSFHNRLNRSIRLVFNDGGEQANRHLLEIDKEFRERLPGYRDAAYTYLRLFLMTCCRQALASGFTTSSDFDIPASALLERLRRQLDNDFTTNHTLKSLAEFSGLSPNYLCKAFKRYTGKTVFEYLIHRRIQDAMIRLRSSNDKIMTIAFDCGFNDLSYFNRTFRRLTGSTPTAYRQNIHNNS